MAKKDTHTSIHRSTREFPANKTESPFDLTGAEWAALSPRKQNFYVETAFHYWRRRGFPFYRLSDSEMVAEFARLSEIHITDVMYRNCLRGSNAGLRLANHFHPQMWSVRVSRYMSPMDCFMHDDYFRAAIRRSLSVWPERHGANASCIRRILKSFSNCAAVSNFRPVIARAIIARYTASGETVVDFSAGYGGRLVGALSLSRHYVGIDPCAMQVRGLRRCIAKLSQLKLTTGSARIYPGCAEVELPKLPSRFAQLVFTSPPYFDWEKYSNHPTQSSIRFRSYPDWLAGFLRPVVEQSYRVLANGGTLAVNFPNGGCRTTLLADLMRLTAGAGFRYLKTYQLRLSKVPYLHPRNESTKWEALAVFSKGR
jgi:hypothetical protein